jgi:hypothetical protein
MIRPMRPIAAIGILTALSACSSSNTPTAQQQYQAQFAQRQMVNPNDLAKSGQNQVRNIGGNNGIFTAKQSAANNTAETNTANTSGSFCFPPFLTCDSSIESGSGGYERRSERSRPIEFESDRRKKNNDEDGDDKGDKKAKRKSVEEALTIVMNGENKNDDYAKNVFSRLNLREDLKATIRNETKAPISDKLIAGWNTLKASSPDARISKQFSDLEALGAFEITHRWGLNQICVRSPDPDKILKKFKEKSEDVPTDDDGQPKLLTLNEIVNYTCYTSFSRPKAEAMKVTPDLVGRIVVGSAAEKIADQIQAYSDLLETEMQQGPIGPTLYVFDDQDKSVYKDVLTQTGNGSSTSNSNLTLVQASFQKDDDGFTGLQEEYENYFQTNEKNRALYELLMLAGATDSGNWSKVETDLENGEPVRDLSVRSANRLIDCKWTVKSEDIERILRAVKPAYGAYKSAQEEIKKLGALQFRKAAELHKVPKADAKLEGKDKDQFFFNAFVAGKVSCFFLSNSNAKIVPITKTPSLVTQ